MDRNETINHQLNQRLAKNKLPIVDVTARVMARIDGIRPQRSFAARKPLRVASIAAAILIISGFGYAMVNWQLHRADGSVSLEYRNFMPGEESADSLDISELRKQLNPGEAAFFVTLNKKGEAEISGTENYLLYNSLEQLKAVLELPLHVTDSLTGTMVFKEGHLIHSLDNLDLDLLRAELEQSGLDIYMKKVGLGDPQGVSLLYQNDGGGEIRVTAFKGDMWRTVVSDLEDQEIEKIMVHNQEVLAVTEHHTGKRELHWMDEGSSIPMYVTVTTETPEFVSQDELLAAARTILQ
ncbi:hypothetical protein PAECIP111893_01207 [Paenibacillus plantiphilus]|uniref:DUF4367 domain-containing protein n=1 Tax=Paenibacillus plantiphilus TaxID=2905650 RepID=A0ABN8G9F3_9BACL|nr:hypothetical protein [Paenibacillus plantiphilus]CAH1199010.1 hypothetical protein PAECIP111893_01207 [Paenibacillus plantiphilus]